MIRAEVMAFYQAKELDGDRGLVDTRELARSNAVGARQRAERHRAAAAEADKVAAELDEEVVFLDRLIAARLPA